MPVTCYDLKQQQKLLAKFPYKIVPHFSTAKSCLILNRNMDSPNQKGKVSINLNKSSNWKMELFGPAFSCRLQQSIDNHKFLEDAT